MIYKFVKLPWFLPMFRNHSMALGPKWSKHKPVLKASSTVLKGLFLSNSLCLAWHRGHLLVEWLPHKMFWTLEKRIITIILSNTVTHVWTVLFKFFNISQILIRKRLLKWHFCKNNCTTFFLSFISELVDFP